MNPSPQQETLDRPPLLDDAQPPSAGSGSASDDLTCSQCGRAFTAKIALWNHRRAKHGDQPAKAPQAADIPVKRASKPSQRDLKEIQDELAQNVRMVGQVLHPLLINLKLLRLQNPDGQVQVPGTHTKVGVPAIDTHLAYTIVSRSDVTAATLVKHAESNETLLKWLVRFNSWFKGGEVGQLIGAHAAAAAATVGLTNPVVGTVTSLLIPDVLEQVQAENFELRQRVAELQAQAAAVAARDGRGAGN